MNYYFFHKCFQINALHAGKRTECYWSSSAEFTIYHFLGIILMQIIEILRVKQRLLNGVSEKKIVNYVLFLEL